MSVWSCFTRARFHPLHVDSNKTSLSMTGAVSQWLYTDVKYELSHTRDLQWLKLLMALLPPRETIWGPGAHNTQHGHRDAAGRGEVRWGSRNKLPRPGGWQEISDQLSCSFTTHWLQWQNHPAGFFLQPQHFCPVLKSTTPFCRHNCFPVCSVSSIMENGSIWDDIFSGAF